MSGILGLSARKWKLPGLPRITLPNFSFEKTFILEGGRKDLREFEEIKSRFKEQTKDLSGVYGFYVFSLIDSSEYGLYEEEIFSAASLIKLPVMITFYKEVEMGNLALDTEYSLKSGDKKAGAGILSTKATGTVFTYRQLTQFMGQYSDNTAFGVIRGVLGERKIQEMINGLGMRHTSLAENVTSPKDIGILFKKLWQGNILSDKSRDELLDFLTETAYEDRIPAGLPSDIRVSHKIGTERGAISDAGIVFTDSPFVLVLMTKGAIEKEARDIFPNLARLIYDFEIAD